MSMAQKSQSNKISSNQKKVGKNFLGILNDLKRRPEDAAVELGISFEEITQIIDGKKILSQEIIEKAAKIWPVNVSDFYMIHDDTPTGVKVMSAEESKMSSRIMNRAAIFSFRARSKPCLGPRTLSAVASASACVHDCATTVTEASWW